MVATELQNEITKYMQIYANVNEASVFTHKIQAAWLNLNTRLVINILTK